MDKTKYQRVLVTGANRGLGRELVRQYLALGAEVWGTARNPENSDLPQLTQDADGRFQVKALDITDSLSLEHLTREIASTGFIPDLLINNAGIGSFTGLDALTREEFMRVMETNTWGPFQVSRALAPYMAQGSVMVQMSSRLGSLSYLDGRMQGIFAYAASKAGLNAVSRQLAWEFRSRGITVIAQSPGWVRTDMGGDQAPLSPEESVSMMIRSFEALDIADTGSFHGENGERLPW